MIGWFKSILVLLCLGGISALGLFVTFETTPLAPEHRSSEEPKVKAALSDTSSVLRDEEFGATFGRPLFSPSRRPYVAPEVVAPVVDEASEQEPEENIERPRNLRLLGVASQGSGFVILITNRETGETRWLKPGDEFNGWRLDKASMDHAEFSCLGAKRDNCSYPLSLYEATNAEQR
ncbi:hypothetical protein [Rhizobium alvei]|uniref:Uncharacterized protein n=1 Tax=Rhizobium alvei TaxID=1132659 RepID=A0ABT8YNZ5_9HYPH|nr:hypothetical protein [Rhizobium alvei]MDO6965241.1 hypothetical protein [Rhizobium alvei]